MPSYLVSGCKPWNRRVFYEQISKLPGEWDFVESQRDLEVFLEALRDYGQEMPRYIFFLHWSWIVPEEIWAKCECVNFHMTAIPPDFPVLQGIGINAGQGTMDDPGHVALHVTLARQAGAAGFLGFCYRPQHTTKLLLPLRDWLP